MPTYEYECQKCKERFEVIRRVSEPNLTTHSQAGSTGCTGLVRKLISLCGFQLKGEGWEPGGKRGR